ncbi:MAG: hypothetical protein R3B40_14835 [Polyangiales bacterium]
MRAGGVGRLVGLLVFTAVAAGCGEPSGTPDAGMGPDGDTPDLSVVQDGALPDAADSPDMDTLDSGAGPDADGADASAATDASTPDDAGGPDTGTATDIGTSDTGPQDTDMGPPENLPPALDVIAATGNVAGYPIPPFTVGIYDDSGDATLVTLTAWSSDTTFLPDANIVLSPITGNMGGRAAFDVTLTPATNGVGEADVTIEATDPEGLSSQRVFHVSVTDIPANDVTLLSQNDQTPPGSANGTSSQPSASGDGRFVVYASTANDIAGGMPSAGDLYVRDRMLGTTTRLGIVGRSGGARITPSGRYIVFASTAASLVSGDLNGATDVFVFDRQTGTYDLVSQATDGTRADAPSSEDPSYVGAPFRRPAISDDGRYVVFASAATNLVPGDTNGVTDVFVRDRVASTTTRVSVSTASVQANGSSGEVAISGDGAVVAFDSVAQNLIDGAPESDTHADVYLSVAGVTTRVSSAYAGGAGNGASTAPSLSSNGRYVAFSSAATNLLPMVELFGKTDIYVLDRTLAATTRVNLDLDPTASQGHCYAPVISANGQRVAFASDGYLTGANNGQVNGYLYDLGAGTLLFLGRSLVGGAPNGGTGYGVALSADGSLALFQSAASNLYPGDQNGSIDVFAQALP